MLRNPWIASVAITIGLLLAGVSGAVAAGGISDPVCVTGNCTFTPATETTSTGSDVITTVPADVITTTNTTSTSNTKISRTEVKKKIKAFEKKTKVIIAVHMVPRGVKSAKGCVDPIRKGWIKAGGQFRNTRLNGLPFWDLWEKGWQICDPRRVKIGDEYYMKGKKRNCGNKDILIPLGPARRVRHRIMRSIEVPTYQVALTIIEHSTTTTTTTGTTTTKYICPKGTPSGAFCIIVTPGSVTKTYSCPKGGELVMKDGKQYCKFCPPPTCTCPPGTTPGDNGMCYPPPPPPVEKTIKITSMTTLNDIPTGKSSGPFYIGVNASSAGGSVTVDPGIGAVSKCDSTTPTGSVTFSSLSAGNTTLCVVLYAPSDPLQPATMTVTVYASLGTASDTRSSTFGISYPVRP